MSLLAHLLRWTWNNHYRISPIIWYLILILSAASIWLSLTQDFGIGAAAWPKWRNIAWLVAITVSAISLTRWQVDKYRTHRGLLVPAFHSRQRGLDLELQNRILTHLHENLSPTATKRVHPLSVVVGSADWNLARRLHRHLRAGYVVFGDIFTTEPDAQAFARVLQSVDRHFFHLDLHTRDVTPSFSRRAELFYRLSPAPEVKSYEYSPNFGIELETLIRVLSADAEMVANEPENAMALLSNALGTCIETQSPQVDALVADLAGLADLVEGPQSALRLVYSRAERAEPEPAPDLLRTAHHIAFKLAEFAPLNTSDSQELIDLGIGWLRRAARQEADPERDVTLYNLAGALRGTEESLRLLREVTRLSPFYRRAWYVHMELGSAYWYKAIECQGAERSRWAAIAARHYSKSIWRRPKSRWFYVEPKGSIALRRKFERRPIMYANAADAHREAGNSGRYGWYRANAVRIRARMLNTALSAGDHGEWARAYSYFDWARTGRQDSDDVRAHVGFALAAEASAFPEHLVERAWKEADRMPGDQLAAVGNELRDRWDLN